MMILELEPVPSGSEYAERKKEAILLIAVEMEDRIDIVLEKISLQIDEEVSYLIRLCS